MHFDEAYAAYIERQNEFYAKNPYADYELNVYRYYEKPFQIFGNLWYVGNKNVCMHLIDTGDGLLVFDSGAIGQEAMLVQAIWEAGFNPANVKWMIHAHAHLDHFGGARFFSELFGTKQYVSAVEAKVLREHPGKTFIQDSNCIAARLFDVDVEIQDGETIRFGNTEIKFVTVPGHTEGCLCSFFDVTDGVETKRVGYFGGYGLFSLFRGYLEECDDSELKMRETFMESLMKVRNEPVDILIGNHPVDNDTLGKHQYMIDHPGENPFIDPDAFRNKMDAVAADLKKLMESDR